MPLQRRLAPEFVGAAAAASGVLYVIANGAPNFSIDGSGFAANGYGAYAPGDNGAEPIAEEGQDTARATIAAGLRAAC